MMKGQRPKPTSLPERSWLVINNRLLTGDTIESLQAFYESIVPEGVEVKLLKGHNMPTVSSTDTVGYRLIQSIVEEIPRHHHDALPAAGRHRCPLFQRYLPHPQRVPLHRPALQQQNGARPPVNERIDTDILADNVEFYVELIKGLRLREVISTNNCRQGIKPCLFCCFGKG